jgi:hypothetical protein
MKRGAYSQRPTMPAGPLVERVKAAFDFLRRLHLGPFRFNYSDTHSAVFLQMIQKTGKEALSLIKITNNEILFGLTYRTMVVHNFVNDSIVGPITLGSSNGSIILPGESGDLEGQSYRLKACKFMVKGIAGVANIQCDLYKGGGGTVLAAPVTLTAAACPFDSQSGDVVDDAEGSYSFTVRVAVAAGGTATLLQVAAWFQVSQLPETLEHPGRLEL